MLRLLGTFHLEKTGTPIPLPRYQRARALLAFLAVEKGPHSREFLADLLWPMQDAVSGRENLRRMLFQLKELLQASPLEATRTTVRLPHGTAWRLDVAEFMGESEPVHQADIMQRLASYRGHFMYGFALDDSPPFEQWMEARRAEYQSRFVALSLRLADLLQRSEGSASAIGIARHLVLMAPWAETGWQCLLRLLVDNGRIEEARGELTRCRAALQDELGIEPSVQTLALLDACAPPAAPRTDEVPERRQMTVLHCELGVPDETDPETQTQRFERATQACRQVLLEAGAHVTPTPGGLLGYFGFPLAREGDARRAAHAALDCIRTAADVGANEAGGGAQARIGLHSGIVISQAGQASPDMAGLVVGLAARVREAAAPGEALMSASTRRLIAHICRDEAHGKVRDSLSGREIEVFSLLEVGARRARWAGDSPLVGRTTQLAALEDALQDVLACGTGRLVLLSGAAGSGKTRLLRELAAHMAARDLPPPEVFSCLPERSDKFFHPFLDWLKAALEPAIEQNLSASLAALDLPAEATPVIASLLGIDATHESTFRHWQAGQWSKLAIAALSGLLRHASMGSPADQTPIFVEDVHWSDPLTRELCIALAAATPGRLVVLTTRTGFEAPWLGSDTLHIALPPLDGDESLALAKVALAENPLDMAQLARVVSTSGGVPLFIEELVRQMSIDGELLPLTLHDTLQARVDSAGTALPTLRLCASMGASVDAAQLALIEERATQDALRTLETLTELGLLEPLAPGRFGFHHALLREAAYQSQTRSAQAAAHQKIVRALLQHQPDAAKQDPELFAWHYTRAGEIEAAIRCHAMAGGHAAARSLYREALTHYQTALDLIEKLPEGTPSAALKIELRLGCGIPLLALHGNGSAQAIDNFRDTLALAAPMGNDPRLFQVYWGLWLGSSSLENFHLSREFGEKLVALAQQSRHPNTLSHAHYALGNSLFCLGRFAEAACELEQGTALYDAATASLELGEDPLVTNLSFLSWADWFCGRHDEALAASRRAVARARELNHPYTLGYALVFAAILHRLRREPEQAETHATEAFNLAERFGIALWQAAALVILGWSRVMRGDPEGMNTIFNVLSMVSAIMGGVESMFLAHLIEASHAAGMPEPGLQAVERGLAVAELRKDWHYLAEFQRMKGELLLSQGASADQAAPWFAQAAHTAAEQGSPSLQLRAAISQARCCIHAEPGKAHNLLATALARLPPHTDTGDVREALELAQRAGEHAALISNNPLSPADFR
ncbi:MAG: hypothetical protein B7Y40_03830 [Gammaproteobacteria bacterium 28-57-27]|nr:MAG: hypothetical protein B7Y40_03830 [Gammaproteobacteria bacterium 28-57-27]